MAWKSTGEEEERDIKVEGKKTGTRAEGVERRCGKDMKAMICVHAF